MPPALAPARDGVVDPKPTVFQLNWNQGDNACIRSPNPGPPFPAALPCPTPDSGTLDPGGNTGNGEVFVNAARGCSTGGVKRGTALPALFGLAATLLMKLLPPEIGAAAWEDGVGSRRRLEDEAEAEALACCMAEAVRPCRQSSDRYATRERRVSVQSGGAGRVDAEKVL